MVIYKLWVGNGDIYWYAIMLSITNYTGEHVSYIKSWNVIRCTCPVIGRISRTNLFNTETCITIGGNYSATDEELIVCIISYVIYVSRSVIRHKQYRVVIRKPKSLIVYANVSAAAYDDDMMMPPNGIISRSSVNSLHKGQWRGPLMFSLICAWINGWVNMRRPVPLGFLIGLGCGQLRSVKHAQQVNSFFHSVSKIVHIYFST